MSNKFIKKLVFIIVIGVLLAQLKTAPVYACTATPTGQAPLTTADWVAATDIVLLGTVTEYITEPMYEQSAVVQVEQYLKGSGPEAVTILGFGDAATCRRQVAVDDRFVFYVKQYADGSLHAYWLSAGEAVAFPSDALINEIATAVGTPIQTLIPPTAETVQPEPEVDTATPQPPTEEPLQTEAVAEAATPLTPIDSTLQTEAAVETPTPINWLPWSLATFAVLLLGTAVVWYRQRSS